MAERHADAPAHPWRIRANGRAKAAVNAAVARL